MSPHSRLMKLPLRASKGDSSPSAKGDGLGPKRKKPSSEQLRATMKALGPHPACILGAVLADQVRMDEIRMRARSQVELEPKRVELLQSFVAAIKAMSKVMKAGDDLLGGGGPGTGAEAAPAPPVWPAASSSAAPTGMVVSRSLVVDDEEPAVLGRPFSAPPAPAQMNRHIASPGVAHLVQRVAAAQIPCDVSLLHEWTTVGSLLDPHLGFYTQTVSVLQTIKLLFFTLEHEFRFLRLPFVAPAFQTRNSHESLLLPGTSSAEDNIMLRLGGDRRDSGGSGISVGKRVRGGSDASNDLSAAGSDRRSSGVGLELFSRGGSNAAGASPSSGAGGPGASVVDADGDVEMSNNNNNNALDEGDKVVGEGSVNRTGEFANLVDGKGGSAGTAADDKKDGDGDASMAEKKVELSELLKDLMDQDAHGEQEEDLFELLDAEDRQSRLEQRRAKSSLRKRAERFDLSEQELLDLIGLGLLPLLRRQCLLRNVLNGVPLPFASLERDMVPAVLGRPTGPWEHATMLARHLGHDLNRMVRIGREESVGALAPLLKRVNYSVERWRGTPRASTRAVVEFVTTLSQKTQLEGDDVGAVLGGSQLFGNHSQSFSQNSNASSRIPFIRPKFAKRCIYIRQAAREQNSYAVEYLQKGSVRPSSVMLSNSCFYLEAHLLGYGKSSFGNLKAGGSKDANAVASRSPKGTVASPKSTARVSLTGAPPPQLSYNHNSGVLVKLPYLYQTLYTTYIHKQCQLCFPAPRVSDSLAARDTSQQNQPKMSFLCLLSGKHLCASTMIMEP